jgi:hypothetical protein
MKNALAFAKKSSPGTCDWYSGQPLVRFWCTNYIENMSQELFSDSDVISHPIYSSLAIHVRGDEGSTPQGDLDAWVWGLCNPKKF